MEYYISNLENSLSIDMPLLSLAGAFVLIDSMGALDTEGGNALPQNFKVWVKKYLPKYLAMGVSEEDYYTFRCALLHQLSGSREDISIPTLLFLLKGAPFQGHMNRINNALQLDVPTFVRDVISAARECITQSIHYKNHKQKIITLHQNGLEPYIVGIPVIGSKLPAKRKK